MQASLLVSDRHASTLGDRFMSDIPDYRSRVCPIRTGTMLCHNHFEGSRVIDYLYRSLVLSLGLDRRSLEHDM